VTVSDIPALPEGAQIVGEGPCDWCQREVIDHTRPPAIVAMIPLGLGDDFRQWRICRACQKVLAKTVLVRRIITDR
jgi:hypothetical protein